MNMTCIFFGALFVLAGVVFASGNVHPHIPAWKNMPQAEKETIKILPLCCNIGAVILLSGVLFLVKGFWSGFSNRGFVAAMILWLIVAGFDVWYIEKSNRYQNECSKEKTSIK